MSQFWYLMVFFTLPVACHTQDIGPVLQLDGCALQNVVTEILTNKETLDKMAKLPGAKSVLGKKGASPLKGISHIKVEELQFTEISLNLLPGTGIRMSVTNKIHLSGRSFLGGRTDMKMEVNIVTYTSVDKDNSSCPRFIRSECQINLIDVKANLPKGILPNVMNTFLDKNLKNLLPTTLCPAVDKVLLEVDRKLCMKDNRFPLGRSGSVLYLVSEVPQVSEEHIVLKLNVTVQEEENVIYPSGNTTASFDLPSTPRETSFLLTAEFLGLAFTVLQKEGIFNLTATQNELTEAGAMSISALSDNIPELPMGLQDFQIAINVHKVMVTLNPSKALLHLYSTFDVLASSEDSEPQPLFSINLHMNFRLQFSVDKSLHSEISLDRIFLSLASSSVGIFEVQDLEEFISSVLQDVYAPTINNKMKTVIPLPDLSILSIDLAKARAEVVDGLLMISVISVC